ncbi:hypothetical protein FACS1894219_09790 [Clostridia bacterium]|nr:hypothetical protein FACS1894219_09790 [Clostridia bacterium]
MTRISCEKRKKSRLEPLKEAIDSWILADLKKKEIQTNSDENIQRFVCG